MSTPVDPGADGPVDRPSAQSGSRRARRAPFALVVVGLLALGLVGQLLLNTALQHGSFELHTLTAQARALDEQRQALEQTLAEQEEPATLATLARRLGLVPSEHPVFLRLADGAVTGTPVVATAPPPPPPPPATTPPATPPATTPPATPPATTPPATAPPATTPPATP